MVALSNTVRRSRRIKHVTKLRQKSRSAELNGDSQSKNPDSSNKRNISISNNKREESVPRRKQVSKRKSGTLESLTLKKPAIAAKKSSPAKVVIYSSDVEKLSPENKWTDLDVTPSELRASATLTTGQCFNWVVVQRDDLNRNKPADSDKSTSAWGCAHETEWIGAIQEHVISIRETPTTTLYRVLYGRKDDIRSKLKDYFQFEVPLCPLYQEWSENDERLAKIAKVIPGVRILRQDPIECLFSFICSSNNNIPRITKMMSAVRERYGERLLEVPTRNDCAKENDESNLVSPTNLTIYSFPTLQQLQVASEEKLREMGLGYRAKYIIQTRDLLLECGGKSFLMNLRHQDAEIVQNQLMRFSGVGRKVADCVALFSLDQTSAIPVDVHVQHIASRDYDPTVLGTAKSLTPTIYKRVGDLFRERFQSHAGWAHSLLFIAELPSFRDVLPDDVRDEMDSWRNIELARKAAAKKKKKLETR